ncbi:hypothetical protein CB0940_00586 [Cercospora beticola]|uniref:Uncharacterized protein n=2 Tax=Cercospora beticola TaxID=122368 RepID=A0A2G5I843_CERBT|nr:hypothetical protein CB0940_00586 [Cercospora beticola]PIB00674.1 hypothetical protein CB0940_00586 [Cercospora beticola]
MAPLLSSAPAAMPTASYGVPETWESTLLRVDSPFSNSSMLFTDSDASNGREYLTPGSSYVASSASPEACVPVRPRKSIVTALQTASEPTAKSTALRFFVVDDPKKLKDKTQLKANRQHVMHDYLDKERQKPTSKDIRITKSGNSRKRKRSSVATAVTTDSAAPSKANPCPHNTSSADRTRSVRNSCSSDQALQSIESNVAVSRAARMPSTQQDLMPKPVRFADDIAPLIRGIAGGFNNSRYLRASMEKIPGPNSYIGSNIQPFACWPTLNDPSLNVEQLKWSCSRKFGTRGISLHWVPTLLKSRHAFLSTICISASHDDIMMRGQQAPHERLPYGSTARLKVRSEVLALINQALADPETQSTDGTIIAILQVLNSEMMGCDDQIMQIHQNGLHDLVGQRGGLSKLGLDGQLASIITITMYVIGALRETQPRLEYVKHASQPRTSVPHASGQIPESPLYTRPTGYESVKRAIQESSPTFELLQLLRRLTHAFVRETTRLVPDSGFNAELDSVCSLRERIFALPSSCKIAKSFSSAHTRSQYESLRLTALVYSHALATRLPFSAASAQLSRVYNGNTGSCNLNSDHLHNDDIGSLSWHTLVQKALVTSNLSDCWGHMAGVLFFITLIAGACANPDSVGVNSQREPGGEEDESRKWLAAVTIRCSIVLSFEHGGVVLDTLKRLVGIQQVLGRAVGKPGLVECRAVQSNAAMELDRRVYGPAEPPRVQQTFADFAMDFMKAAE